MADGKIPIQRSVDGRFAARFPGGNPAGDNDGQRVTSLYDVMDSAYDAHEIIAHTEV